MSYGIKRVIVWIPIWPCDRNDVYDNFRNGTISAPSHYFGSKPFISWTDDGLLLSGHLWTYLEWDWNQIAMIFIQENQLTHNQYVGYGIGKIHLDMAAILSLPLWVEFALAGIIQGMGSAIERRCYIVTLSISGWAHTHNDPWLEKTCVHDTSDCKGQDNWESIIWEWCILYRNSLFR